MIAEKNVSAVFRVREDGSYVACAVKAWREDGAPMAMDRRRGLVDVREHPQFIGLLEDGEKGNADQHERWFRRSLGLASDAPLQRCLTSRSTAPYYSRPFVPQVDGSEVDDDA
jgi:hypothetical protein